MADGAASERAAAALRTALVGEKMIRFDSPRLIGSSPVAGRTIESVRSHGKHIEIVFDDELVLHTHMRLSGTWHLYRPTERWRKGYRHMRASIETHHWIAVCFDAPTVETYQLPDRRRHPGMGQLGPNLCNRGANLRRCVALMMNYPAPATPVADVMLDQRVMAGVGNVYRSEVLWACELNPWAPVSALAPVDVGTVVTTAAHLLQLNLGTAQRINTVDVKGGLAVYGRVMQRCVRCGSIIEMTKPGQFARVVYWCPGCQVRHDPHVDGAPRREMDPHPAAAKFLNELPWRQGQPPASWGGDVASDPRAS